VDGLLLVISLLGTNSLMIG